jgi:hypothetical protein
MHELAVLAACASPSSQYRELAQKGYMYRSTGFQQLPNYDTAWGNEKEKKM